jgi:hypothetical protein
MSGLFRKVSRRAKIGGLRGWGGRIRTAACRNARAGEHGHRRKGGEQLIDPTGDKAHWGWGLPDSATIRPRSSTLLCGTSKPGAAATDGSVTSVFKVCEKEMRSWRNRLAMNPPANLIRWIPGVSNEARDAVNAAFDAMSTWRTETVNNSERNREEVIEKMAAAGHALGWPEQIVDATRSQMQTLIKTQTQMMDQMMDAWEEQIKSPNPSAMLTKLKSLSSFGPAGSWPNLGDVSTTNPMQFSMQFVEQWQKVWSDSMAFWTKAASSPWPGTGT